jgi:hypothetical protein
MIASAHWINMRLCDSCDHCAHEHGHEHAHTHAHGEACHHAGEHEPTLDTPTS